MVAPPLVMVEMVQPAPSVELVASAPAVTYAALAPVVEDVAPAPAVPYAASAPVDVCVTSTLESGRLCHGRVDSPSFEERQAHVWIGVDEATKFPVGHVLVEGFTYWAY